MSEGFELRGPRTVSLELKYDALDSIGRPNEADGSADIAKALSCPAPSLERKCDGACDSVGESNEPDASVDIAK